MRYMADRVPRRTRKRLKAAMAASLEAVEMTPPAPGWVTDIARYDPRVTAPVATE